MGRIKAEYIWMDGHKPTSKLRSKTKIIDLPVKKIEDINMLELKEIRKTLTEEIVEQFAIVGTAEECLSHMEKLIESGVEHIAGLPFENGSYDTQEILEKFSEEVIGEIK